MIATAATSLDTLAQHIARQQTELEALRREYETRQTSLADLNRQKQALKAQLRQIDADIRATAQGSPPGQAPASRPTGRPKRGGRKAKRKHPKTTPGPATAVRPNSLPALLLDILGKARSPLAVKQIAMEVVRRKYQTTSSNLPAMVDTRVRDLVKRGLIQRASGQPGFVLAGSGVARAGKTTAAANGSAKNGAVAAKAAAPPKTNGQQLPLRALVTNLLAKSRRPLRARDLADQILASGYQTKSKNFIDVMWVALGQMDNIANVAGKGYVLKR